MFNVPLEKIVADFSYDPAVTNRVVTIGIDSYSIRHTLATVAAPDGFSEDIREPIAISIPQLQADTDARYTTLLANDFSLGVSSQSSVSLLGKMPSTLSFIIGLANPIPTDATIYHFNAPRLSPAVPAPNWSSQYVRAFTIRFYVKVSYEPNHIPFMSAPRGVGAMGDSGASAMKAMIASLSVNSGGGSSNQQPPSAPAMLTAASDISQAVAGMLCTLGVQSAPLGDAAAAVYGGGGTSSSGGPGTVMSAFGYPADSDYGNDRESDLDEPPASVPVSVGPPFSSAVGGGAGAGGRSGRGGGVMPSVPRKVRTPAENAARKAAIDAKLAAMTPAEKEADRIKQRAYRADLKARKDAAAAALAGAGVAGGGSM